MAGEIQLNSTTMATESSGSITAQLDTIRPNTTNGSLTLQGDSSDAGVTGLTIDSSGNATFAQTISGGTIGSSVVFPAGSLSNPYTNIETLRTNLASTKSNGDIDYLYFSDGRDVIQLYVFWLTVNSQMNAYVLVGGGNDGSDALGYSRHSTFGNYPKGFPLSANDTSTDNRVFGNFHIGFNFVATLAQASADYIAAIDAFGNFGTTYINNSSWWDNVKNQVCDDATVTNVASSGNFYKGTFSQSSNITASDTSTTTQTNAASIVVGNWDSHWYYSNPGNHSVADGVWLGNANATSTGKDGLIFIR